MAKCARRPRGLTSYTYEKLSYDVLQNRTLRSTTDALLGVHESLLTSVLDHLARGLQN